LRKKRGPKFFKSIETLITGKGPPQRKKSSLQRFFAGKKKKKKKPDLGTDVRDAIGG